MKELTLEEIKCIAGCGIIGLNAPEYAAHLANRMQVGALLGYAAYLIKPDVSFKATLSSGMAIGFGLGMMDHIASVIDSSTVDFKSVVEQHIEERAQELCYQR